MNVDRIEAGYLNTNCYAIGTGENAIVVDPGGFPDEILKFLEGNGITGGTVLLTHGHFDHCLAVSELQKKGFRVIMSEKDAGYISGSGNLSGFFGVAFEPFVPDVTIVKESCFKAGDIEVGVLFTPGHTPGSVTYLIDGCLFTGDTMFRGSAGRTDFEGGSAEDMRKSLLKLALLKGNYTVYPGHGPFTDLDTERRTNPFIGG